MTSLQTADLRGTLLRYQKQGMRLWLLDQQLQLTDIRAMMGGHLMRCSDPAQHLNPLQGFWLQDEERDAEALATLLSQLIHGLSTEPLRLPLRALLSSREEDDIFKGALLQDLALLLRRFDQNVNAALIEAFISTPAGALLNGKSTLPKGQSVIQFTYAPTPLMHSCVALTLRHLAAFGLRHREEQVVLVIPQSPLDTPQLAKQLWEAPEKGLIYLRPD